MFLLCIVYLADDSISRDDKANSSFLYDRYSSNWQFIQILIINLAVLQCNLCYRITLLFHFRLFLRVKISVILTNNSRHV